MSNDPLNRYKNWDAFDEAIGYTAPDRREEEGGGDRDRARPRAAAGVQREEVPPTGDLAATRLEE